MFENSIASPFFKTMNKWNVRFWII